MQAHAAAGDSAEALRVYERCRRLLADELGAYPSPETESIHRDLLRAPSSEARAARPETGASAASLRTGDPSAAGKAAEEAIRLEPYRESGYRRLIQAHAAAGNRAEALTVYERCRKVLAEELGAYPSPETESIYRELLAAPPVETEAPNP